MPRATCHREWRAGFKRSRGSGASPQRRQEGAHPGGAGLGTGVREEAFSLTLDFYAPVLFATKREQKSDRRVLVHSPSRGSPAPQPLAPAGVWQVGTVPLSVPPSTWPRLCQAVDRDRRHALRPHLASRTCSKHCDPALSQMERLRPREAE